MKQGVIHRDLKPVNTLISPEGFAKILDFGLAKVAASPVNYPADAVTAATPRTLFRAPAIGTIGYMSPEQARGEAIDFRSDQFALELVYRMAAGRQAFSGRTHADTLVAILEKEPEPLAKAQPTGCPAAHVGHRTVSRERHRESPSSRPAISRDLASVRAHLSDVDSSAEGGGGSPRGSRGRWPSALGARGLSVAGLSTLPSFWCSFVRGTTP